MQAKNLSMHWFDWAREKFALHENRVIRNFWTVLRFNLKTSTSLTSQTGFKGQRTIRFENSQCALHIMKTNGPQIRKR